MSDTPRRDLGTKVVVFALAALVTGCTGTNLFSLAAGLGEIGAVRICALSAVPFPPPWWHHDGQGPLASLLRWVDLEGPP